MLNREIHKQKIIEIKSYHVIFVNYKVYYCEEIIIKNNNIQTKNNYTKIKIINKNQEWLK